jgi:HAD superfamily hydrolase (TIGR01509 family)
MPGAEQLIAELRRRSVPRGLVTSADRVYADPALDIVRLAGAFDVEVTGDMAPRPKPAPDLYLLLAEKLGIAPICCVALEDSPSGVAAAKAAGSRCLAVPNTLIHWRSSFRDADAVLDSLSDVIPWAVQRGLLPA